MTITKRASEQVPIRIWERVQVVIGGEGHEGMYTSRVVDIRKDRLIISRPVFIYGHSLLADNRRVQVNFTRADAAYAFSARLKEASPKLPDEMLLLELGEIKRLQRRRFVRIDKVMPVGCLLLERPVPDNLKLGLEAFTWTRTFNVSAGGVLIQFEEQVAVKDLFLLDLARCGLKSIPSHLVAVARQVRKNADKQQVVGLEFILSEDLNLYLRQGELAHLPEQVRGFNLQGQNELVTEIFSEQLTMRQKGLI